MEEKEEGGGAAEGGSELMAFLAKRRASIDGEGAVAEVEEEGSVDRWRCWGSSIRRIAPTRKHRPSILQVTPFGDGRNEVAAAK